VTVKVFPVSRGTVQLTGSGERMSICSGDFTRVGSGGDLINAGSTSGSSLLGCWSESCSSSPGAAPSVARIMSTFQTHMYCTCISMMLCTNIHTCIHTHTHTHIQRQFISIFSSKNLNKMIIMKTVNTTVLQKEQLCFNKMATCYNSF